MSNKAGQMSNGANQHAPIGAQEQAAWSVLALSEAAPGYPFYRVEALSMRSNTAIAHLSQHNNKPHEQDRLPARGVIDIFNHFEDESMKPYCTAASGLRGVRRKKARGYDRWQARIRVNRRSFI
jgi:hypothetical protein